MCVFLHANGYKGAECHPATHCPKNLEPVVTIRPLERGHIVGLWEAGWTYQRIATHIGHNVSVVLLLSAVICETFPHP